MTDSNAVPTRPSTPPSHFDVAILGAGSAGENLAGTLGDAGRTVVVFEPGRVGGECPFVACMPSKALLHDARVGMKWHDAIRHRDEVVEHLDDTHHAQELERAGVTIVRAAATFVDGRTLSARGSTWTADHIVIATGSEPVVPDIEGLDEIRDLCWTSEDALTTTERPTRMTILGGGVIGCELAHLFVGFGTEVHIVDPEERGFPDLAPELGEMVDDHLREASVRVCRGASAVTFERRGGNVMVRLDNDASLVTDRIVMATGTRPRVTGLGLEQLGLDPSLPLPVGDDGRVEAKGSIWAIGDVAGRGQYTHLANHQARVVADQLIGSGTRRFSDSVTPACVFTEPPVVIVGPTMAELADDDDVTWVRAELSEIARWSTDNPASGFLTLAVHRPSRRVVAAHGVGEKFDELAVALVTAIDGGVSIDRLAMSMQPFPTISEILGPLYSRALEVLSD